MTNPLSNKFNELKAKFLIVNAQGKTEREVTYGDFSKKYGWFLRDGVRMVWLASTWREALTKLEKIDPNVRFNNQKPGFHNTKYFPKHSVSNVKYQATDILRIY